MQNNILETRHIFIFGNIGIGKSTLVQKLLNTFSSEYKQNICGFYTKKIVKEDGNYIFINSAKTDILQRHFDDSNLVGIIKNGVRTGFVNVFNTIGVSFLEAEPSHSIFIMDEIGFLEANANVFSNKILSLLETEATILAVCKPIHTELIEKIKTHPRSEIYDINSDNRDELFSIITKSK